MFKFYIASDKMLKMIKKDSKIKVEDYAFIYKIGDIDDKTKIYNEMSAHCTGFIIKSIFKKIKQVETVIGIWFGIKCSSLDLINMDLNVGYFSIEDKELNKMLRL